LPQIPSYKEERDHFQAEMAKQVPAHLIEENRQAAARLATQEFALRAPHLGHLAPPFSLINQRGAITTLDQLRAAGPVVLIFYRGEWCPYCNLQLRAFQAALPELTGHGARLAAISPQRPDNSLSIAEKHGLEFDVLSDIEGDTIAAYGLRYEVEGSLRGLLAASGVDVGAANASGRWELPAAATFVVAQDGSVAFGEINGDWTERTEPARVIEVLDRLGDSEAAA
jgi:peroxiredoxin